MPVFSSPSPTGTSGTKPLSSKRKGTGKSLGGLRRKRTKKKAELARVRIDPEQEIFSIEEYGIEDVKVSIYEIEEDDERPEFKVEYFYLF